MRKLSLRKTLAGVCLALVITLFLNGAAGAEKALDKKLHFNAGLVLSAIFYSTHAYNPNVKAEGLTKQEYRWARRKEAFTWALGAAIAAGSAKELSDSLSMGTVEWKDLESTVLGGLAGAIGFLLLDYLVSGISDLVVRSHPQGIGLEYQF